MNVGAANGSRTPLDHDVRTFAARAMASPLRLTVVASGRRREASDAAAWRAVQTEFESSEQVMSRFREGSEITILNRRGVAGADATSVSRRLRHALAACDRAHRLTAGRFDPRVLADLERLGDRGAPVGEYDPPADWRRRGGRIYERCAPGLVRLQLPVDLGGIGKGLALRWASRAVQRVGVASFLIDAGGDVVAHGAPPDPPWRVGIEDPGGGDSPIAVVSAEAVAVVTSSVRRRRWVEGGRTVHHLIDPRTGEPGGAGLLAVTVAGSDPAWSEVWSKALFLEGRAGIATLARSRGLAAWWITDDGGLEMTAAGRMRTIWTAVA